MAAMRTKVHMVAQAPARTLSAVRVRAGGSLAARASSRGKKTRLFIHQRRQATADNRRNPGQATPRRSRNMPRSKGGKNPPIPPIAPTSPVTVALWVGKYRGTRSEEHTSEL